MTPMTIVTCTYLAAMLCVVFVELRPRGITAKVVALASIAFVSAGGAAWSYAAYLKKAEWPELYAYEKGPSAEDDKSRRYSRRRGKEIDPEAATGDIEGTLDDAPRADGDAPSDSATTGSSQHSRTVAGEIALILGITPRATESVVRDCDGCPPLIEVPAGTMSIGALDADASATSAERPAAKLRVWPGFLIGSAPVTNSAFRRFQIETNRRAAICATKTADLSAVAALPVTRRNGNEPATCVAPGDADAYVNWLTARTGKRFRLVTAAEWEYAAKILPTGMTTGNVAEIVADCWHQHVPRQGLERIAAQTEAVDCQGRMIKGAAALEVARWHRFSARRHIAPQHASAQIGFRVMRSLDGRR